MITEEQLRAILGMGDVGGAEDEQTNQLTLAKELRNAGIANRRMDVGSQIGRGAYGIAGAIGDYKGLEAGPKISGMKQGLFASLLREMKKKQGMDASDGSGVNLYDSVGGGQ